MSLSLQQFPDNSRTRILSEEYGSLIFHNETYPYDQTQIPEEYLPQPVDWQYTILNVPLSDFPADMSRLGYFTIPKLYTTLDSVSMEASGISQVQSQPYLGYTGRGIILGFVDTGIDYRHPVFRNADGTSRILAIWDQTIQTGNVPEGFLYGSEYTKEQIDAALRSPDPYELVPSRDESGHGTGLAGIAAGNTDTAASFSGAAPDASILMVRLKPAKQYLRDYYLAEESAVAFQEDDCMLAIRYLHLTAMRLSRPLVICFGLGSNQGGHDGFTPLDEVMSYLSYNAAGNYLVIAGGNEGDRAHHYFGKIASPGESQEVEVVADRANRGFTLELWAYAPDLFALGVTSPLGERISPSDPRIGASQRTYLVLDNSFVQIDHEIVEFRSGSQLIQARVVDPSPGIWRFQVENRSFLNGSFHIWLPITGIGSPYVRMLNPDPDTTLTTPSNNSYLITASTYQASTNTIYLGSSRGFTRNDQLKPDIAAPGVNVLVPYGASGFRQMTGSSISAGITAGAVAMLIQWGLEGPYRKLLSSVEIQNLLYRGATRSASFYYPNREWGYGALNVYDIFQSLT